MSDAPPPLRPSASFKRRSTRPKVDELKVVFDQFDGDKGEHAHEHHTSWCVPMPCL